jgi:hypothetical protein
VCTYETCRKYFKDKQKCIKIEADKPILYLGIDQLFREVPKPTGLQLIQDLIYRLCQKQNARLRF